MDLKPSYIHHYPPFTHGRYFEEYFSEFWNKRSFDEFVFIDIHWCAVYHRGGTPDQIRQHVFQKCKEAWRQGKIPFTVCQWDDGIGFDKPPNLIVFSMGQSKDVPLPLISEDTTYRLLRTPRLSFDKKNILCSFVGSNTFHVREKMVRALDGLAGVVMHMKNWDYKVESDAADLFVDVTRQSKFGLAPRGYGASSFRFFEVMQLGVIPVYIHDGDDARPFQDILDYSLFSFSVHVSELDTLYERLAAVTEEEYQKMCAELEKVRLWFTMEGTCEYILMNLLRATPAKS
jgi:hypothetical protein